MADLYEDKDDTIGVLAPPRRSFDVVPHATNPLPHVTRSVYVGGTGTLVVRMVDDTTDRTLANVAEGLEQSLQVSHVRDTSTATNIVGFY